MKYVAPHYCDGSGELQPGGVNECDRCSAVKTGSVTDNNEGEVDITGKVSVDDSYQTTINQGPHGTSTEPNVGTTTPTLRLISTPFSKGRIIEGGVLGVIMLVCIVIGLMAMGWYIDKDKGQCYETRTSYGLFKLKEMTNVHGEISYDTEWYSTNEAFLVEFDEESEAIKAAKKTRVILLFGLMSAILFVILAFVGAFGRLTAAGGYLPVAFGLLAGFIILTSLIYFANAFPEGLEEDIGKDPGGTVGVTWYLLLICAMLGLAGAVMSKVPIGPPNAVICIYE